MGFRIEGRFVGMILLVMVAACGGGQERDSQPERNLWR